jgi:hypothetical protein
MGDIRCTRRAHIGDDDEGRCSSCGERIDRPSRVLFLLVLFAMALAWAIAALTLIAWWYSR